MKPEFEIEINQLHAGICAALADPIRIMMLYALAESACNVGRLSEALSISQSSTSRHLKVLRERGLVHAERRGANVEYQLTATRLIDALDILRGVLRDTLTQRANLVEAFEEA